MPLCPMDIAHAQGHFQGEENMDRHTVHNQLLENNVWIFGYGSLLWKPDFPYNSKQVGYIEGYERRFYQGNVTFRGKPDQPGRVANVMENTGSRVWGMAYEICEQELHSALQLLNNREMACGGYVPLILPFYPRDHVNNMQDLTNFNRRLIKSPHQVLLYTATPENDLYLGPDDMTCMARQIVNANGSAGSNVEYICRLAEFVRKYIPEDNDTHLFHLEAIILKEILRQASRDSS